MEVNTIWNCTGKFSKTGVVKLVIAILQLHI